MANDKTRSAEGITNHPTEEASGQHNVVGQRADK